MGFGWKGVCYPLIADAKAQVALDLTFIDSFGITYPSSALTDTGRGLSPT